MESCQVCNERPAELKIFRISAKESIQVFSVCPACALKVSDYRRRMAGPPVEVSINEAELKLGLQKLILLEKSGQSSLENDEEPSCSDCGLVFSTYRQTYMLGCPSCYDAFGEDLIADIRKIHGATRHKGASPAPPAMMHQSPTPPAAPQPPAPRQPSREERLELLQQALEEAVASEEFAEAARLRDEIRSLLEQEAQ